MLIEVEKVTEDSKPMLLNTDHIMRVFDVSIRSTSGFWPRCDVVQIDGFTITVKGSLDQFQKKEVE